MDGPELRFRREDGTEYPEWEGRRLGDICTTFSGGTPKSGNSEYYNGNINFIRSGEIHAEETELTITNIGFKNSSAKLVHKGDLLFALYGATAGEADISKIDGAINQAILCIRPIDRYNRKFLCGHLNRSKENIRRTYLQGGQGNLSADIVRSLHFSFPCLEEQQKIVAFLSDLDEVISASKEEVAALEEQKKGIMQKIFSQEVRFKREDGSEYPEWEEKRLGNLCEELRTSINPQNYPNYLFTEYSMPAFDNNKLPNSVLGKTMQSSRKVMDRPCVLINKLNVRKARVWLELNPPRNAVCSAEFIPLSSNTMDLSFLAYMAISNQFTSVLLSSSSGSSNSQKRVRPNIITDMIMHFPCLEEQKKIAAFLSDLDTAIDLAKQELEKWKLLKKGLMQQMFV